MTLEQLENLMGRAGLTQHQTRDPSDTPETTAERRRILDEAQTYTWPSWSVQPCGTPAAYQRHIRRREPPCRACTNAAAAERLRNKRKTRT